VSQDAPVTKVWRKSINRYWKYSGNMKIWDALGHAVTLNFDLLTPKSNQFISVPRCTSDKSLAKIRQQILEISRKQNYHVNHGRTHGRTAAPTDDPKTYSLRRRLPAAEAQKNYNIQISGNLIWHYPVVHCVTCRHA